MKKNLLCASLLVALGSSFSANAGNFVNSYSKVGYDVWEMDYKSPVSSVLDFESVKVNTVSLGYGYKFTKNMAFEVSFGLPVNDKILTEYTDTYKLYNEDGYSDTLSTNYNTQIEMKHSTSLMLKLDLPLHERFDVYGVVGYSKLSLDYKYTYNQADYTFLDHEPAEEPEEAILNGETSQCVITGQESSGYCDSAIVQSKDEIDESGFIYGMGFRFYYTNNVTLGVDYSRATYDAIDADKLSFNIEIFY